MMCSMFCVTLYHDCFVLFDLIFLFLFDVTAEHFEQEIRGTTHQLTGPKYRGIANIARFGSNTVRRNVSEL